MLSLLVASVTLGVNGQVPSEPFRLPRYDYRIPSYPGAFLLHWGLVQDDLGLPSEVVKELGQARDAYQAEVQAMVRQPPVMSSVPNRMAPAAANALARITPAQKKRLGEIYFQYYDVNALSDAHAAKLVGLSQGQRAYVAKRLNEAHSRYQDAQQAAHDVMRKDNEPLRLKAAEEAAKKADGDGPLRRPRLTSYVVPREIQYRHTDLSRRSELTKGREMTKARADVRSRLTAAQLATLSRLKGQPISIWFFDGQNWESAKPHPDLILNTHVQAELGFSLKQHLAIQKMDRAQKNLAATIRSLIDGLSTSQREMLQGFELQYDREYSILRPDVSSQLGLDRGTVDRILLRLQEIEVEASKKREDLWVKQEKEGLSEQIVRDRQGDVMRTAEETKRKTILYFLTAAQKAKWHKMLGKPLPEIQPSRHYG